MAASDQPDTQSDGDRDPPTTQNHDAGPLAPQAFGDRRFRTLVEQVRDFAIFMMDADGRHVTWNEGVLLLTGYEETEFLGLHATVLFTPEDRARGEVERELRTATDVGRASDDRWLVRKNGSRFWATGITTRLNDDAGHLIGFSKVFRDLTTEKEAQDRLRSSEERLRVALIAARMGIWRWHLPTNTQRVDGSMARLLGLGAGDVAESYEQFREHIHPEDRVKVDAAFGHALQSGQDMHVEFRVVWPDGSIRWLLDHGMLMRSETGAPEYLTGAAIDVTERKLAEERLVAAQRMDAVGQLAGGVAHEINNMMTAVLGFSELLLNRLGPGDPSSPDLRQIRRAASRAATITGQLLAFSRRQLLRPEVLDLNQLVRELEPMLRQVLGEDRFFATDLADDLGRVRADPGQMQQVLINLALNAPRRVVDGWNAYSPDGQRSRCATRGRCPERGGARPWELCRSVSRRYGARHGCGHSRTDFRAVFYHQTTGPRDRAWARHCFRRRAPERRVDSRRKCPGPRNDLPRLPARGVRRGTPARLPIARSR